MQAMIKNEMRILDQRSRNKRKSGLRKFIGRIATAKKGTLRLQAAANVFARFAGGGAASASSSSMGALPSPASSPPFERKRTRPLVTTGP